MDNDEFKFPGFTVEFGFFKRLLKKFAKTPSPELLAGDPVGYDVWKKEKQLVTKNHRNIGYRVKESLKSIKKITMTTDARYSSINTNNELYDQYINYNYWINPKYSIVSQKQSMNEKFNKKVANR